MSLLAKEMSLMFHQNISNLSPMIMSPDSGPKSSSSREVMLLHIYITSEMSGVQNEPRDKRILLVLSRGCASITIKALFCCFNVIEALPAWQPSIVCLC